MRIALVVPGGVDRSGRIRVIPALLALIERIAARHRVDVFALRQEPQPDTWELRGARIHNIGARHTRLRALRTLCREHARARFDVIHGLWSGGSGLVAVTAGRLLGVRSLVHVAGGELVRVADIGYGGRLHWRGRLQQLCVLRAASLITAASAPLLAQLAALGHRAERVPLGVDLQRWRPQEPRARRASEPLRLIQVATLNPVKDQRMLLEALALLRARGLDYRMSIVGEDTLQGRIQSLAQALGVAERVRFHGFLPQEELHAWVGQAHAMIISSRHEAGPLAVLEAGALGVPTIGTRVGHIAEWSPEAALAVPVGDASALAQAIERVAHDEALRLTLARAALARARSEDADYTASCFLERYARLAS